MKKIFLCFCFLTLCFVLTGCTEKKVDYSEYSFTDVSWERQGDHDSEVIRFTSDGEFWYSCGCGNPVNDSDLCDSYRYNDKTKEIELVCMETTSEMVTTIKIVNYDDNNLELDFNGEIRKFTKETE